MTRYLASYPVIVVPLAGAAGQDTSSAGVIGTLDVFRATVGVAGLPASASVMLMIRLATQTCPWTVHFTCPV